MNYIEPSRDAAPSAMLEQAHRAFQAGRPSKAAEITERFEAKFGPTVASACLRCDIHFFASDYQRALAAIGDAVVLATRQHSVVPNDSLIRKAAILTLLGRQGEAIDLLAVLPLGRRKANFFRTLRQAAAEKDVTAFERVASPSFFRKDLSSLAALNHYAILLRDKGDARASLVVARTRFLKACETFRFGHTAKPAAKPGWAEEAAACLSDLKKVLDQAGIPFFLVSGTFLGAHRDNGIIGHDKDIDVGVDEVVASQTLIDIFAASPVFTVKDISSQRCVYLVHANGVNVDVFVHYLEGGRYWHEGAKVRWWNSPFGLKEVSFLEGTYKVPDDADRYLSENYGEWQTPVSDFETFVDTPNMEVTSPDHVAWYYLTKLTDYHLLGRMPQFARVWTALQAIYQPDNELGTAAQWVLEQSTSSLSTWNGQPSSRLRAAISPAFRLSRWTIRAAKRLRRTAMDKLR